MSNPTRTQNPTTAKKKKKKNVNWKQVIIIGAMAVVVISMAAPGLIRSLSNMGSKDTSPTSSETSKNSSPTNMTTEAMPEPVFEKEGELRFMSATSGQAITKIDIEKADTDAARQFGLMYRKSMGEDQGMLFLFDNNEQQAFWMHNTYISLDIMFVDENNIITTIHENTKPLNDTSLPSKGNAKYVVEVIGGYAKKHGIKVGDRINWE